MNKVGIGYLKGKHGLTKNLKKAEELFQSAYDLGDANAAYNLSILYSDHIPDQARMIEYELEGARRGNAACMNNLAVRAGKSGNHEKAKRLYMMAARSGDDFAMKNLMVLFQTELQLLSKEDLATTFRTHKATHDKAKSEPREYAMRHKDFKLKMVSTGQIRRE